jgi:hypothetical protein
MDIKPTILCHSKTYYIICKRLENFKFMKSYTIQKPTILYAKDLKNLLYDTHSKRILVFNFYIKYYCFFFLKKNWYPDQGPTNSRGPIPTSTCGDPFMD